MRWLGLVVCCLLIVPFVSAQTRPFAEGSIDNPRPYVGEPIIYSLKLYSQSAVTDGTVIEPSFFGFGRSGIIRDPSRYTENRDGVTYRVVEQSYIVYPLRSGDLTIDPFQITIPETPFDPEWLISSDALTITVRPYPEPMPDSFINGVGQFDISAEAFPRTVQARDSLTFRITISGTGNLEQLIAPDFDFPETWQVFDGQTVYEQNSLRFGTKTFEWTIIVPEAGIQTIPAIPYSYFNPQSGTYESQTTAPIELNILESTPAPDVTIERQQEVIPTTIPPQILTVAEINTVLPATPPYWFWLLWILPPSFTVLVWVAGRPRQQRQPVQSHSKKPIRGGRKQALQYVRQRLKSIPVDDPSTAYQAMSDVIYDYITAKVDYRVTHETVNKALKNISQEHRQALKECLDEALTGQYAPITSGDVIELKRRILRVCDAIEKAEQP